MFPGFFHCTRRDMLVDKDLSDCIGCPLRTLNIHGEPAQCGQYLEYAQKKLRAKFGLPEDIVVPPETVDKFTKEDLI